MYKMQSNRFPIRRTSDIVNEVLGLEVGLYKHASKC